MSSVAKALNWGKKGRELPEEEKDGRRDVSLFIHKAGDFPAQEMKVLWPLESFSSSSDNVQMFCQALLHPFDTYKAFTFSSIELALSQRH